LICTSYALLVFICTAQNEDLPGSHKLADISLLLPASASTRVCLHAGRRSGSTRKTRNRYSEERAEAQADVRAEFQLPIRTPITGYQSKL
jgi:hypothetical protein